MVIKAGFLASKKAKDLIFRSLMQSTRDKSNIRVQQKSKNDPEVNERKGIVNSSDRSLSFEEEIRVRLH